MRVRSVIASFVTLLLAARAAGDMTSSAGTPARAPGGPYVARSAFTTRVVAREPVDNITTITTGANRIYYFADVRNLAGQTVTQTWVYRGQVMSRVSFPVRGPRWRVYSEETLLPSQTGEWKASVTDSAGVTLAVNTFDYVAASARASGPAAQMHKQQ
ncbi:MAG: DUF2914 domain-containing protein [Acidiferrobacteraceae bacterium]